MNERFSKFASWAAYWLGSAPVFISACLLTFLWGISGPVFKFSDTWQLWANTATTIVTFLMVFIIQNTQNRDAKAIHLKLNEVIRSINEARDSMIDIEHQPKKQIDVFADEFSK